MFYGIEDKENIFKSYILNTENQTEFIIKKNLKTYGEYSVCNNIGEIVYSVKIDPKPLDKRIKYVFTEHETQNEFYAWADYKWNDTETNGSALKKLYDIFVTPPIEFYIEAESFFGELCIRRSKFNKFDILINNKLKGLITNHKISCDEIDDKALLAMLYVFQNLFRIMKKELVSAKIM